MKSLIRYATVRFIHGSSTVFTWENEFWIWSWLKSWFQENWPCAIIIHRDETYKCSVSCVRGCLKGLPWVYKYYSRIEVGLCKGPLHVQRGKKSELKELCLTPLLLSQIISPNSSGNPEAQIHSHASKMNSTVRIGGIFLEFATVAFTGGSLSSAKSLRRSFFHVVAYVLRSYFSAFAIVLIFGTADKIYSKLHAYVITWK